jgi:hypothetical protein
MVQGSREECGMNRTKDDYPTVSLVEPVDWVRLLAHRFHSLIESWRIWRKRAREKGGAKKVP